MKKIIGINEETITATLFEASEFSKPAGGSTIQELYEKISKDDFLKTVTKH